LERKKSDETPPIFFIQACKDAIDRLVLFGHRAVWMLSASLTNALMEIRLTRWFHDRSP
jgi:hypothetical protein